MTNVTETSQAFVQTYLQRSWTVADGLPETVIRKAEARLGISLPPPLRAFHLSVGAVADLCNIHNTILHPKDIDFEEGYLMIMDENQSVVSWGIKKADLKKPEPIIWQRNNQADKWYSEKKGFLELLASMLDWYSEIGVWKHIYKAH